MAAKERRDELIEAAEELHTRGLAVASTWAAETALFVGGKDGWAVPKLGDDESAKERAAVHAARSFLERGEWWRAAHVAGGCSGARGTFLRCYARFLGGARRAQEALQEQTGPGGLAVPGPGAPANAELPGVAEELLQWHEEDPLCEYLLAGVRREQGMMGEFVQLLKSSLRRFPWNWEAWEELATGEAASGLSAGPGTSMRGSAHSDDEHDDPDGGACSQQEGLPRHWLLEWWRVRRVVSRGEVGAVEMVESLLQSEAPGCPQLRSLLGQALYDARDLDRAEEVFEGLIEEDPHRVEGMDTYSNVLYVKGRLASLSFLAHRVTHSNKYRPESCIVVGNYFSARGEHARAVEYFKRALKLHPRYTSAWTLTGHEYIELRNPAASVAVYRRAVELSPRDFRAWYGLGQTYELLGLPLFALHYFQRAANIRPKDPRMWSAVGQCLEHPDVGSKEAAAAAYQRALEHDETGGEGGSLARLAELHSEMGDKDAAAHYHERNLDRLDQEHLEGQPGREAVEALLFLAKHAAEKGDEGRAEHFCHRLMDVAGPVKEEAKALLRDLYSRRRRKGC